MVAIKHKILKVAVMDSFDTPTRIPGKDSPPPVIGLSDADRAHAEQEQRKRKEQQEKEVKDKILAVRRREREDDKEDEASEDAYHAAVTAAELTRHDIGCVRNFDFESPKHAAALNIEESAKYGAAYNERWDGYYDATYRTLQIDKDGNQYYSYPTEDGQTSYIKIGSDGKFFGFVREAEMDALMRDGAVKGIYTNKDGQMVYANGQPVEKSTVESINKVISQFGIIKDVTTKDAESAKKAIERFDQIHQSHEAAAEAEGKYDTLMLRTDLSPQEKFLELQKAKAELEMKRLDEKDIVDPQEEDKDTRKSVEDYADALKKIETNMAGKSPAEQQALLKETFGKKYDDFIATQQRDPMTAEAGAPRVTSSLANEQGLGGGQKLTQTSNFNRVSGITPDTIPEMPAPAIPSPALKTQQQQMNLAAPGS